MAELPARERGPRTADRGAGAAATTAASLPMAGEPRSGLEVVALFGPTGVGKTEIAIALADLLRVRGERPLAISADALQVYAGLETLTGAADARERARLEHRLLSFLPVTETFSAGEFAPRAHAEIDQALEEGRRPIVVGGTGLYLRAALTDMRLRPPPPPGLREKIEARLHERGVEALHAELAVAAPAVAGTIEPTDRSRVIRALELAEIGELEEPPAESQLWTAEVRRPTLLFGLTLERDELYRRIDARVERMVAAGAAGEARRADAAGASRTARKALGFDELLRGDVEGMKQRTRNYSKRQLTWMRKLGGARVLDVTGRRPLAVASEIARALA
jgi:tRNA dimethylallyltransferase